MEISVRFCRLFFLLLTLRKQFRSNFEKSPEVGLVVAGVGLLRQRFVNSNYAELILEKKVKENIWAFEKEREKEKSQPIN